MNKTIKTILCILSLFNLLVSYAAVCPDPNTSSLAWGEIPPPWQINPFSPNTPQGEEGTQFVKANILVAVLTRGVVCTYHNSLGDYSIWWDTRVKRPARTENYWHESVGSYECIHSREECVFYP